MDVTDYLNTYKLSAHDLAMKIILDVLETCLLYTSYRELAIRWCAEEGLEYTE